MNILFLHRSFPGQFHNLLEELLKDKSNKIYFITNNNSIEIEGIFKLVYEVTEPLIDSTGYLKGYKSAIEHGKAAAEIALILKNNGFVPDVIYGHSGWGPTLFMKDIYPDVPLICYFEWFANAQGADSGFDGTQLNQIQKEGLRCSNAQVLMDLCYCDAGISPAFWQKSQFPEEFHNKITVIPDGVQADFYKPNENATFFIKDKNIELKADDEIITYATRGMEPYRGFPQFMEAIESVLKSRPKAQVVIGGEDKVFYRGKLVQGTYKELMLKKLDIDLNRVHFVGPLSYEDYKTLLQVSTVHVYLTVPYVLSWSALDAMSTGCTIVASNTKPVTEVMQDNYNALLVDFYDTNALAKKIGYAVENRLELKDIRKNARQTIINKYDVKIVMPTYIDFLSNVVE